MSRMIFPFEEPELPDGIDVRWPGYDEAVAAMSEWLWELGLHESPSSAPTVVGRTHGQSPMPTAPKALEWMQPLRFERKRVVHRASLGLKKPPAEYIPGSFGEATSTIAKRLDRLIRLVAANTYIPPQYWVSPDVSRMDR